ncbi:hypothetical protein [Bacillus toyonensis]|uniref:hypothetical protein n=1 Tax=Bacillus toyonensis TaxID=155322 RepID=UPI000BF45E78|nr:hypothetical protein [Bacillus toyonensis]PGE66896.1 hypothetical protein COM69_18190 [Bacillus toyonensis]PHD40123.1 hypothetical protein COF65_19750 [Bacillus toyonensis]
MEKNVIVLGAQKFDFENEKGIQVKGTKVYFADADKYENPDYKGCTPTSSWFNGFEKFESFEEKQLPGKYKMEYDIRLTTKSHKLEIKEFTYMGEVE